ncbi:hypothetical protein HPB48_008575 [Haemaphysalis longicornis]|uniref:Uncharacterized protein n=1 Tax=Haemaphysalis longicornis TaxID=44386 RepID=A0A9J6GYH3_HAELO|nr:hypothetical protein HPB48_008575 [Haemaphysalis longicornis]
MKYVKIKDLCIAGYIYEAAAYRAVMHETWKRLIRNVPLSRSPQVLHRNIVNPHNPLALVAKRIKESGTVIIAFEGYTVTNYVRYGNAMVRSTRCHQQIDVCYVCGKLVHHADICSSPEEAMCWSCGSPNPKEHHGCMPKCELCGDEHMTAGKECKQRFCTLYMVRRRDFERAMADTKAEKEERKASGMTATSFRRWARTGAWASKFQIKIKGTRKSISQPLRRPDWEQIGV